MTAKESVPTKTYLIKTNRETLQIDIPDDWKITYGPVAVGSKGYGGSEFALRIYETDTKQRAIFKNVESFRDLSIPVKKRVARETGSDTWESTDTFKKRNTESSVEYSWQTDNEGQENEG